MRQYILIAARSFVLAYILASLALSYPSTCSERAQHIAPLHEGRPPAAAVHDVEPGAPCELDPPLAPPVPPCAWTPEARDMLLRMVRLESSTGRDALAIAWTMARRWLGVGRHRGLSFAEYIVVTSRPLRRLHASGNPRTAGETPHQRAALSETWERPSEGAGEAVRDALDAWATGEAADPCDGPSFQWRSRHIRRIGRGARPLDCGDTANRFFSLPEGSRVEALLARPVDSTSCQ